MLLSHGHRFIFIKTRKTASTSLEMLLAPHLCAEDDIITPIFREDEMVRSQQRIGPKNYAHASADPNTTDLSQMRFWNHCTAAHIKSQLPDAIWTQYTKVTSERHPYEKALSQAWWRFRDNETEQDFASFLDSIIANGHYRNFDQYSIDGTVVADTVIRYEHLLDDTNRFLESIGLPRTEALPKAKSRFRKDARPGHDVLSAIQKKKIQAVCAEEFEHWKYAL